MTSMEDHLQKSEDLVIEAIRRKLGKNYPESTRLLVTFEDFIIKNEPNVAGRLRTAIRKLLAGKDCTFETIYLVGMSEKLLIDYAC